MPRLQFEIEAEDRSSAEVDKLSRNVDALDRNIDDLSRSMEEQARAADISERNNKRLALAMGGAVATAGALAAGLVALTQRQAEYHRQIRDLSFFTGRSQRDLEAYSRALVVLGADFQDARDAVLDFRERVGEARVDPNSEIARSFRDIGFDVNNANLTIEDYLDLLARIPDRQVAIFEARTILGDTGANLLPLIANSDLRGVIDAQLELVLDDDARADLIDSGQDYRQASAEFNAAVDKWLARGLPALTAILNDAFVGERTLASGLSSEASRIGGAFFTAGRTQAAFQAQGPFQALGPPSPSAPAPLRHSPAATIPADLLFSDADFDFGPSRPSFAALAGRAQSRRNRGVVGGPQAVGPGLGLAGLAPGAAGPDLSGILETGPLGETQALLGSISNELAGIHFEISEFLPAIADNTLGAVSAAADFALSPNIVSLTRAGVATARLVGELLDIGRPRPVGATDDQDFAFLGPGGGRAAATTGDIAVPADVGLTRDELGFYSQDLEDILELIDPELVARFRELQGQASEVWGRITATTDDSRTRYELFSAFMELQFRPQWDAFQEDALAAWEANREGLGLNAEQTAALDEYIKGPFISTIDEFENSFIASWEAIANSEAGVEDQARQIAQLVGTDMPVQAALLEAGLTGAWQSALASAETFGEGAGKVAVQQQTEITTLEEAYAALTAGIITAGEFAEISANLASAGVNRLGSSLRAGAHSASILAQAVASIPDRTYTVTEIRRTVYETVGSPPSSFDPARDHPAFGLSPNNPQTFHPVGSGRGPFPLGQPRPGAFDPRNHPANRGFQDGGRFLVDQPSFFLAGEAGRELVQITPENAQGAGGVGGNVEVHLNIAAVDARSVEELIRGSGREAVVEIIRDATSNGEAVVSTRGLVDDRAF